MIDALEWVHHDGSELYVSNQAPELGEIVDVRLRVPQDLALTSVHVRVLHDGEPRFFAADIHEESASERWYVAAMPIRNRRSVYRWLIAGPQIGHVWITAGGHFHHELSDASDFVITAHPMPPAWARRSVAYQVFPDRFAASGRRYELPTWAVPRSWAERPNGRSPQTGQEYFGGDLWGIIDRLDHLIDLGVNVLYLTPFFPAGSTHRYDASTFSHVDPLLGGDEAMHALLEACHARGLKVMGDITLNHCGRNHEWFVAALDGDEQVREFFTFDDSLEHGYECWWGVPSLPKFNYRSQTLRHALISGPKSTVRHWLRSGLDGWRVDVANMTGRQASLDVTHEVAREVHDTVRSEGDQLLLIAEHGHDAGADLDGDGWHGTMNYTALCRPVWSWLADDDFDRALFSDPAGLPRINGHQMVATMRSFTSRMPWRSYVHSWPLLGSHDTARIRSVVGTSERQVAAATLLFTLPGTPMVFAGDEVGAEGLWGEDSRTPFPWDQPATWDSATLTAYRDLIQLRREEPALADGGLRWVCVSDDAVAYLRESNSQRLLVAVARAATSVDLAADRIELRGARQLWGSLRLTTSEDGATVHAPAAGGAVWQLS